LLHVSESEEEEEDDEDDVPVPELLLPSGGGFLIP
jgi:hypothetical protein